MATTQPPNVTVGCIVFDDQVEHKGYMFSPFLVKVPLHSPVQAVKEAIKSYIDQDLFYSYELRLYRLVPPIPHEHLKKRFLASLVFQNLEDEEMGVDEGAVIAKELSALDQISANPWPDEFITVLVKLPCESSTSLENDNYAYLREAKLCKLVTITPSKLTSQYKELQDSEQEKILDDRPRADIGIPPLPLMYSGFGMFVDELDDATLCIEPDLKDAVDELADIVCSITDEREKQDELVQHLFTLLFPTGAEVSIERSLGDGSANDSESDGHVLGPHNVPLAIFEVKAELAHAEALLSGYFLRLCQNVDEILRAGWRLPSLGVVSQGPFISFYGLVMVDKQVRCLPLTAAYPFNDGSMSQSARQYMYKAVQAARNLAKRITTDASMFELSKNSPRPIEGLRRRLPNVSSLQKIDKPGERLNFEIIQAFGERIPGRFLYLATALGTEERIFVKFSTQYGKEAHILCANRAYAPELLAFEALPGGWFGVAMAYLESPFDISHRPALVKYGGEWIQRMKEIGRFLREHGLVHGDLRLPNFIVNGELIMLIDFDWAGKVGNARFPDARLRKEIRDRRNMKNPTLERDEILLASSIQMLEAAIERAQEGATEVGQAINMYPCEGWNISRASQ